MDVTIGGLSKPFIRASLEPILARFEPTLTRREPTRGRLEPIKGRLEPIRLEVALAIEGGGEGHVVEGFRRSVGA